LALEQSSSSQGLVIIVDIGTLEMLDENTFELNDPMIQQQIISNDKLSLILLNKIDEFEKINEKVKIKVNERYFDAFTVSLKEGINVQQNLMEQLK
jgi:50S ribosomal subunit-associated GTPase HflX